MSSRNFLHLCRKKKINNVTSHFLHTQKKNTIYQKPFIGKLFSSRFSVHPFGLGGERWLRLFRPPKTWPGVGSYAFVLKAELDFFMTPNPLGEADAMFPFGPVWLEVPFRISADFGGCLGLAPRAAPILVTIQTTKHFRYCYDSSNSEKNNKRTIHYPFLAHRSDRRAPKRCPNRRLRHCAFSWEFLLR